MRKLKSSQSDVRLNNQIKGIHYTRCTALPYSTIFKKIYYFYRFTSSAQKSGIISCKSNQRFYFLIIIIPYIPLTLSLLQIRFTRRNAGHLRETLSRPNHLFSTALYQLYYPQKQSLVFSTFDIETKMKYGNFYLKTGRLPSKSLASITFSTNVKMFVPSLSSVPNGPNLSAFDSHKIKLRVGKDTKATSFGSQHTLRSPSEVYFQLVHISVLLQLDSGDVVGVYISEGKIYEWPPTCTTRFSAILLSPN